MPVYEKDVRVRLTGAGKRGQQVGARSAVLVGADPCNGR